MDHRRATELAATAIDFDLGAADRQRLDEHLSACAPCRAEALALRGDAAALAALPAIEPPTWVRRAIGRRYGPRRAVLLVAAALVLAATVGVALAVGASLRDRAIQDLHPSPAPITSLAPVSPGPSPSAVPAASPTASPSRGPLPIAKPTSFPAGSGSAWMGASPDGGTWVLTVHDGGIDPTSVSAIALLDSSGRPRPGWPIAMTGWRCGEDGAPSRLPVAADGSIRLVCAEDARLDGPLRHVGFAFDSTGQALPGWPVELPETGLTTAAVMVGNDLHLVASEIASTEGQTSPEQAAAWWQVVVDATGDVQVGQRYAVADAAGSFDVRLAADGIAYRLAFNDGGDSVRSEITAFDLGGVRPGWPVTFDGITSQPVVGPNGVLVVRLMKPALTSQLAFVGPAGGAAITTSGDLPLDPLDDRTGAGAVLLGPVVADDGATWVVGTFDSTNPAVVRVAPDGIVGQRILLHLPLQPQGVCDAQDTGCGVWRAVPTGGPNGTLYVPESAVGDGGGLVSSGGGSLVALSPNGKSPAGWPVDLPDTMAGFWSILPRADGMIDALAVVPTDAGNQWSLAILNGNGTSHASVALILP